MVDVQKLYFSGYLDINRDDWFLLFLHVLGVVQVLGPVYLFRVPSLLDCVRNHPFVVRLL